jgi:hypothetical protein
MYLSGKYSVPQLCKTAKDKMHLKTVQRKRSGGKPIALSYFYNLLNNPVYAGFFFYENKRYELDKNLKRIITESEYLQIQTMLGKKSRPKPQKRQALYSHFLTCEECGGITTPDFKFQLICPECKHKFSYSNKEECPKCKIQIQKMNNPIYLFYTYYRCLNQRKHRTNCNSASLEEKTINQTISNYFKNNLCVSKELSNWCIKHIGELKDNELEDCVVIQKSRDQVIQKIKTKLNNLLDLRISRINLTTEEIDTFDQKEKELKTELIELQNDESTENTNWLDQAKKQFNFMSELQNILENGNMEDKKELFYTFRTNLKMNGKNLSVFNAKSINLFIDCLNTLKIEFPAFEPEKSLARQKKNSTFGAVVPSLLRG